MVAAAGADKKLHVLQTATGQTIKFEGHNAPIRSVRFVDIPLAQCPIVATASWDKTIRYWDLRQQQPIGGLKCGERVYGMDTGGPLLVATTADLKVHLVDLKSNPMAIAQTIGSVFNHQIQNVAVSPTGSLWGAASIEGRASVNAVHDKDKG
jgi:mRNA export factor